MKIFKFCLKALKREYDEFMEFAAYDPEYTRECYYASQASAILLAPAHAIEELSDPENGRIDDEDCSLTIEQSRCLRNALRPMDPVCCAVSQPIALVGYGCTFFACSARSAVEASTNAYTEALRLQQEQGERQGPIHQLMLGS